MKPGGFRSCDWVRPNASRRRSPLIRVPRSSVHRRYKPKSKQARRNFWLNNALFNASEEVFVRDREETIDKLTERLNDVKQEPMYDTSPKTLLQSAAAVAAGANHLVAAIMAVNSANTRKRASRACGNFQPLFSPAAGSPQNGTVHRVAAFHRNLANGVLHQMLTSLNNSVPALPSIPTNTFLNHLSKVTREGLARLRKCQHVLPYVDDFTTSSQGMD